MAIRSQVREISCTLAVRLGSEGEHVMSFSILFLVGLSVVSIVVTVTILAIWFAKRSKPDDSD